MTCEELIDKKKTLNDEITEMYNNVKELQELKKKKMQNYQ